MTTVAAALKTRLEGPLPAVAYPFRGVLHFIHHPRRIAGPILSSAVKASVLSLVAIVPIVRYGFGPQAQLASRIYLEWRPQDAWFAGIGASITGGLLCLMESFAVVAQLHQFLVGSVQDRFFDTVLQERGRLPPRAEASRKSHEGTVDDKSGSARMKKHAFLSPVNIMILTARESDSWRLALLRPLVFLATLPLNFVPVVGPASFVAIQAIFRGGETHKRYFNLHHWSDEKRQQRVEEAFGQYLRFGMLATALEMIPFAGFVFSYTNQIGAAMWITDINQDELVETPTKTE
ncbi:uncharacterized protein BYT42DRAFT_491668 [Radiomyces spectabilis]|uniref:uncharacterized protein n=1 Tax=Radiomyces spectabilis TaxID=64574 RepID=UPI0022209D1E|nr:uncharacterized protein BYT42DRAFT_491668 [Radiomyces spectabilis]KAI8388323.1 hypothetical protein BYT42DRAFT_491668 [Radiomyces spectabilis]